MVAAVGFFEEVTVVVRQGEVIAPLLIALVEFENAVKEADAAAEFVQSSRELGHLVVADVVVVVKESDGCSLHQTVDET